MKYMVCVDQIENGVLIGKSLRLVSAPDSTILVDAVLHMIAANEKTSRKKFVTCAMPISWIHNNSKNSNDRGAVRVKNVDVNPNEHHWIIYYKQIRDHEVVKIKEEDHA